ncbi:MAG: hypothetical protein ACLGH0_02600 [Thermoanaerobaculia bacterium]
MPTVSDFVVLVKGEFWLPDIKTSLTGKKSFVSDHAVAYEELPAGVLDQGILSFVIATHKGEDDGIDLAFKLQGYSWGFNVPVYFGIQVPVTGLKAKPAKTIFNFDMTKGGTLSTFDPDEYLNGKGKLRIGQVCLHYRYNI